VRAGSSTRGKRLRLSSAERDAGGDPPERAKPRDEEILNAAARLFSERGYDGTSVQNIVDELGLLKGSLYHYIGSKEDLLFAIIERAHAPYLSNLERCKGLKAGTVETLHTFAEEHARIAGENVVWATVYNQDFKSLTTSRRESILAQRREYKRFFTALVTKAQEEGLIPPDVPVNLTSVAVLTTLTSMHRWFRPDGELSTDEAAREMAALTLRALGITAKP